MGVEIVKAATVYGRSLSGNAYKVLITMSLTALDKPKDGRPASLYFAGWGPLKNALGYSDTDGVKSAAHTAVKRAVRELTDNKHITPMVTAVRGTRQSYMVHPGGLGMGVSTDPKRGSEQTLKEGLSGPLRGSEQTPLGSTKDGRELNQDISLVQLPQPTVARGKADAKKDSVSAHAFQGTPGDDCLCCGRAASNRRAHPIYLIDRGTG